MNADRIAVAAATALVAAGLIAGFARLGSPGHARTVQLDARRVDDVKALAERIEARYGGERRSSHPLPERLPANFDPRRRDGTAAGADPITRRPYRYERIDNEHYRLCLTFATAVAAGDEGYASWPHPSGPVCYRLELDHRIDGWPAEPPEIESPAPSRKHL